MSAILGERDALGSPTVAMAKSLCGRRGSVLDVAELSLVPIDSECESVQEVM